RRALERQAKGLQSRCLSRACKKPRKPRQSLRFSAEQDVGKCSVLQMLAAFSDHRKVARPLLESHSLGSLTLLISSGGSLWIPIPTSRKGSETWGTNAGFYRKVFGASAR